MKLKKKNKRRIYKALRLTIDPLFRKKEKKIVLYASTGSLDDNLECVSSYIKVFYPEMHIEVVRAKVKRPFRQYLIDLYHVFTSFYIIADHAIPQFISGKRRRIFNVWHGIPLKNIRHLDRKRFTKRFLDFESKNINGLVCSSATDRAVMAACFNIAPSKCVMSGLPRADILTGGILDWFEDPQESRLLEELDQRRLIAWMPTYRGTWHQSNLISGFTTAQELKLRKLLQDHNCVFGVRPHKFSELQSFPILDESGLLIDLSEYSITNTVLKHTRHLITDYSSVWLDYTLVSNSISLYLFDNDQYQNERGMIYPLDEVFPGKVSLTFEDFYEHLYKVLDLDINEAKPNPIFFKHTDNNNTKRLVDAMFKHE